MSSFGAGGGDPVEPDPKLRIRQPDPDYTPPQMVACARAGWEAIRAYRIALGDPTRPHWEELEETARNDVSVGVLLALSGQPQRAATYPAQEQLFVSVVRAAALALGVTVLAPAQG